MITSDETIEVINARYNERTIIKLIKQFITEELHGRYAVSTLKTKKYVMYQFTSYLRKLIENTNECMDCFLFPCDKTKHSGKCPLRNPPEISIVNTKPKEPAQLGFLWKDLLETTIVPCQCGACQSQLETVYGNGGSSEHI